MHKILIVEDEDLLLWAIARYLEKKGYQAFTSHTGQGAMEIVKKQNVDLVVTDLLLPDTTGMVLIDEIKSLHPDMPIITITASSLSEEEMERIVKSVHRVLWKPFEMKLLEGLIREILGGQLSAVDSPLEPDMT